MDYFTFAPKTRVTRGRRYNARSAWADYFVLAGVMLVKVALELPFALWAMKGFLMASPGRWRWLPW